MSLAGYDPGTLPENPRWKFYRLVYNRVYSGRTLTNFYWHKYKEFERCEFTQLNKSP
jgi:hypothetical protein